MDTGVEVETSGVTNSAVSGVGFYDSEYRNRLSFGNKMARVAWTVVYCCLFRYSPVPLFGWRRFLLNLFGAKLALDARVYPSARIWAPWNLTMEARACLGPEVYCYSVAPVYLGADSTVSFRSFLCTASHDINNGDRRLVLGPIRIGPGAFVFADAFIGLNVIVGEGAVVAARAVVVRSVDPMAVVAGNPAKFVSQRNEAVKGRA